MINNIHICFFSIISCTLQNINIVIIAIIIIIIIDILYRSPDMQGD